MRSYDNEENKIIIFFLIKLFLVSAIIWLLCLSINLYFDFSKNTLFYYLSIIAEPLTIGFVGFILLFIIGIPQANSDDTLFKFINDISSNSYYILTLIYIAARSTFKLFSLWNLTNPFETSDVGFAIISLILYLIIYSILYLLITYIFIKPASIYFLKMIDRNHAKKHINETLSRDGWILISEWDRENQKAVDFKTLNGKEWVKIKKDE